MTAVVWANVLLATPFLIAFTAIPLWMTFKGRHARSDHSQAHAYLRAKAALAQGTPGPVPSEAGAGRRHVRRVAVGRRAAAGRARSREAARLGAPA
jgi:hypothetical protein